MKRPELLCTLPPRPRTNGPVIAVPPEKTMLPKVASRSPAPDAAGDLDVLVVIAIVRQVLGHVAAAGNGDRRLLRAGFAELPDSATPPAIRASVVPGLTRETPIVVVPVRPIAPGFKPPPRVIETKF